MGLNIFTLILSVGLLARTGLEAAAALSNPAVRAKPCLLLS